MTAADRGSLRGAGRAASGPLIATWQMMEWIRDNGPADRETIKDACAGFVDPGYARRWYAARRAAPQNAKRMITTEQLGQAQHLARIDVERARRAKVGFLLNQCLATGTLSREGDVFTFVRMPKRTPGGLSVEAVTSDPAVQARHVYAMELVRQLRAANKRGAFEHGRGKGHLVKAERSALLRWLGTFDHLDAQQITVTGVELDAIVALRGMRARQAGQSHPQETTAEKDAVRALWLALDNYATR